MHLTQALQSGITPLNKRRLQVRRDMLQSAGIYRSPAVSFYKGLSVLLSWSSNSSILHTNKYQSKKLKQFFRVLFHCCQMHSRSFRNLFLEEKKSFIKVLVKRRFAYVSNMWFVLLRHSAVHMHVWRLIVSYKNQFF